MKLSITTKYRRIVFSSLLLSLCLPAWAAPPSITAGKRVTASDLPAASQKQILAAYGKLPLAFERNLGQADRHVPFLAHGPGYSLFLSSDQATLRLAPRSPGNDVLLRMRLLGSNTQAVAVGQQELAGKANYLLGNQACGWQTNVPLYQKVSLHNLYPGIDLVYYGNQTRLEYDFVLAPKAAPAAIRLGFEGAQSLKITKQGELVVGLSGGQVVWQRPVVYQQVGAKRIAVAGRYALLGKDQVGFQLGRYDTRKPLVIDPVLAYSTYLGGNGNSTALGIAVDSAGNAYVAGTTNAGTSSGTYDGFVAKLNPTGSALVYATFVGGSGTDTIRAIALDANDNAYVTGDTTSTNFPVTTGAFQTTSGSAGAYPTAFVSEINASGNGFVYSSYLGGSKTDSGYGIAVDSAGNAYVVGRTQSANFPVTAGALQTSIVKSFTASFITKMNPTGTGLVYSTYLGAESTTIAYAIAINAAGNAYVTGQTTAANFPVTAGAFQTTLKSQDAFVLELNTAGSGLVYGTFLGGSGADIAYGIAVDSAGNAYVTGQTKSTDFPVTSGAFQTASHEAICGFVTKVNPTGTALSYSTYLGGSGGNDHGNAIAVDSYGDAYVTGEAHSSDFPITPDAIQTTIGGGYSDVFVTKLEASGAALLYSTFLGGSNSDYGYGIAVDAQGNAYVTGQTSSTQFPVTAGAYQTTLLGFKCGFVTKLQLTGHSLAQLWFQNSSTGQLAIWLMSGAVATSASLITPGQNASWKAVAEADLNGDGAPDIVFQNSSTGQLAVWYMNSSGTSAISASYITPTPPAGWHVVGSADLNGDGKPDLLFQDSSTGQLAVWYMNGASASGASLLTPTPPSGWRAVGLADLNGDGKPDIVFQNNSSGQLAVWFLNGITATGASFITPSQSASWKAVALLDLNGDSVADIVFQNSSTGQLAVWYMSGASATGGSVIKPTPPSGWQVVGPH